LVFVHNDRISPTILAKRLSYLISAVKRGGITLFIDNRFPLGLIRELPCLLLFSFVKLALHLAEHFHIG
jgi:hypothetical protein